MWFTEIIPVLIITRKNINTLYGQNAGVCMLNHVVCVVITVLYMENVGVYFILTLVEDVQYVRVPKSNKLNLNVNRLKIKSRQQSALAFGTVHQ
jgi:hypothetical protein